MQKLFSFFNPQLRSLLQSKWENPFSDFVPHSLGTISDDRKKEISSFMARMVKNKIYNKMNLLREIRIQPPSNTDLYSAYVEAVKNYEISRDMDFENTLVMKKTRINSGVLVFTVVMSPYPKVGETNVSFTCKHDCHFCPKQEGMPRSYRSKEPAVERAIQNKWNPVMQIRDRFFTYVTNGLISVFEKTKFKVELIMEGGTYSSFPKEYIRWFITSLYYALNTIYDYNKREMLSLEEEMKINETCWGGLVVGLSCETRPDCINPVFLRECREYGITRIQIGVQHIDDEVLRYVNRGCYTRHTKKAMKLLLDGNFKIQCHLMPDLPMPEGYDRVETDKNMFSVFFSDTEFHADYIKIYPCLVLEDTEIYKWWKEGKYIPYSSSKGHNSVLLDVLDHMTQCLIDNNCYHIRKERLERDFSTTDILAGCSDMGLADTLMNECVNQNKRCPCIRCREPLRNLGGNKKNSEKIMRVRRRQACEGTEVFISFENKDETVIYGFLRLRLTNTPLSVFPELEGCAMIREVHVYGSAITIGGSSTGEDVQHLGLGKKMLQEAERIAVYEGYNKLSVIAGNGVKEYYRKNGFVDGKYFMIKNL